MKDFLSFSKKIPNSQYILLIPVVFIAGAFAVVVIIFALYISSLQIRPQPFTLPALASYPKVDNIYVPLSAEAAVVMDNDSKKILFSKNSDLRFSPASTTKLMTTLVGLQTYKLDDVLEVKRNGVEGTVVGFLPGQKVTFRNLLYGMLLPSGNDAAFVVADNYPGGEKAFVARMNEMAQILHLDNTHFGDPAGLNDDYTYTTVVDLAHLASIALQQPIVRQVVQTTYATVTTMDGTQFPVESTNKLLGLYGIDGVKTGHTEGAKDVLIASTMHDNHKIITVVMHSDDRFADTVALMQNIVGSISFETIDPQ